MGTKIVSLKQNTLDKTMLIITIYSQVLFYCHNYNYYFLSLVIYLLAICTDLIN